MQSVLPILGFTLFYGIALIARRARDQDQVNWKRDAAITLISFAVAIMVVTGALFLLMMQTEWLRPNLITSIIFVFAIVFVSEGIDRSLQWAFSAERTST